MTESYRGRIAIGERTLVAEIDDLDADRWVGRLPASPELPSDRPVGVTLVGYTVRLLDGRRSGQTARAGNGIRDGRLVLEGRTRFGPLLP
jgi:hypothetical protein